MQQIIYVIVEDNPDEDGIFIAAYSSEQGAVAALAILIGKPHYRSVGVTHRIQATPLGD